MESRFHNDSYGEQTYRQANLITASVDVTKYCTEAMDNFKERWRNDVRP